ncbi:MAG: NUDIX domain-containing protein [Patescibacteria group bacterium]
MKKRFPLSLTVDICLISPKNEILLISRKNHPFEDKLVLPSGHFDTYIENGHLTGDPTFYHAAVRETSEKTGVQINPADLQFLMFLDAFDRDPRPGTRRVSIVFWTRVSEEQKLTAHAGDDALSLCWRSLKGIQESEIGFDHFEAITKLPPHVFIWDRTHHHCPEMTDSLESLTQNKVVHIDNLVDHNATMNIDIYRKLSMEHVGFKIQFCPFCGHKLT